MRLGILVRDVHFHRPFHTTMHLAWAGLQKGWSILLFGVGSLTFDTPRHRVRARAVQLTKGPTPSRICHRLLEGALPEQTIELSSLDMLLIRFNPMAQEIFPLEWQLWWPALLAMQWLRDAGVEVVNDPQSLLNLLTKLHTDSLPQEAAIPGLVTRSASEVDAFQQQLGGQRLIAKPLAGSQGTRVFLLDPDDRANRDQILEGLFQAGYALVQPFLEQGREGDKRVLLVDGRPLEVGGRVAVYLRRGRDGRVRNNIHAGGRREPAEIDEAERRSLTLLAPWLRQQRLRFVGVDLLGGRVLEVNAFCPGGIENINQTYGLDLATHVLEQLTGSGPGRSQATPAQGGPLERG
ncbi:MAG: hypothetical protein FJ125_12795 [Deltaproteobacteria bacterium]|nr:hypothetical protein [Deltaproteobacteria bacterium]